MKKTKLGAGFVECKKPSIGSLLCKQQTYANCELHNKINNDQKEIPLTI